MNAATLRQKFWFEDDARYGREGRRLAPPWREISGHACHDESNEFRRLKQCTRLDIEPRFTLVRRELAAMSRHHS